MPLGSPWLSRSRDGRMGETIASIYWIQGVCQATPNPIINPFTSYPIAIGSKPTVKIPHPAPKIFPDDPNSSILVASTAILGRVTGGNFRQKESARPLTRRILPTEKEGKSHGAPSGGTAVEWPYRSVRDMGPQRR